MKNKIVCPVCRGRYKNCAACKGTGKLNPPKPKNYKKDQDGEMKSAATILRDYGYTLREIAEILGYHHPQSIQNLLNKKPKYDKS
jgi:hypothetical protein